MRRSVLTALGVATVALISTVAVVAAQRGPAVPEQIEEFCVHQYTNVLRDSGDCRDHEFHVVVADVAPFDVCVDQASNMRYFGEGRDCPSTLRTVTIQGDGSTDVTVNRLTGQILYGHRTGPYYINKVI